ncbi:MAG: NADH-quinone oxidoreductase subunit J [Thiotrichales bacterium]|nr:NADH-quinone oxidoreductase subunit J [Thiotrichales bacterium]MCY4285778.1 NADH-quinone oxidoreductase subunit J [Thiotrichales bacterium]MCY4349309.1 NADH-quinone oxidoreductase subunit J [Thiotrichales bacterium]
MFVQIVFYFLAAVLVGAAVMVITARNPVHAALFLVLAFFTSAGIWLLLEAEFLAIVLVLVYVGAVMVLFLFVVMMLDINLAPLREGFIRYLPVGAAVAAIVVVELALVIGVSDFGLESMPAPPAHPADYSNTRELGKLLYTVYVYPFELAGAILLVAIIAAIALTMRRRTGVKTQNPSRQVEVRREDRIRIVQMPAEPRERVDRS